MGYTAESGLLCVAYAGGFGLFGVGYTCNSWLPSVAYISEPDHQCGLHREVHKNCVLTEARGIVYTGESGLSGVGYIGESGLTGVDYTGDSGLTVWATLANPDSPL